MNSPVDPDKNAFFQKQYQKYTRLGLGICAVFFAAIILSATFIRISGAITAPGTVVQTGENKPVQHTKGGAIKAILVEEGSIVNKGDTIVILDSVSIDAKLSLLKQQEFELQLSLDRLNAMESEQEAFIIDSARYGDNLHEYPNIVDTQQSIFQAQKNLFSTNLEELELRIEGLANEQTAIDKQVHTNKQQLIILDESISELDALYKRQLISKSRLTTAERDRVNVLTQLEALKVSKLQKTNLYHETIQRIEKLKKETSEKNWQEIEKSKEELAKTQSEIRSTYDDFQRLEIKAPANGKVHELSINNINEVIKPGDVILNIVPNNESLEIHSKVKPEDIEQLYVEQETRIRFDSFDQNTTPEILGKISFISADSIGDASKGEKHFLVKVSITTEELARIRNSAIGSGLPVSTMFTTNERTLMNYLVKPLSEQLFSAFREN